MDWNLYVRDWEGFRLGEIDDFVEAKLTPVFRDVGTWSVKMNLNSPMVAQLARPKSGLIACRDDVPLVSGPQRGMHVVKNKDEQTITFTGVTDETWLADRIVSPSPGEASGPYSVQATDNRSGVASTVLSQYVNVNAGPGAIPTRRVPGLTLGTDPVAGSTVSGAGRWDTSLLAFLQPIALSGGVGFRVVQVGTQMEFQPYQLVDRSGTVKFSTELGNLASVDYSITAPRANYLYVGGNGTGTARIINEYFDNASVTTWGRIEGEFVDRGDTADATQMQQAGTDGLAQGTEQMTLALTPIETANLKYGTHYNLGDKVSVQLQESIPSPYGETGSISDILRSVTINLTKDEVSVTPAIGTPARGDLLRIFTTLRKFRFRLNQLERT